MAIIYKIGFEANTKGVSSALSAIQKDIQKAFSDPKLYRGLSEELKEGVKQAQILETALKKATSDKGISFTKLNSELQKAGSSVEKMVAGLSGANMTGAMNSFLTSLAQADRSLIQISNRVKELGRVMTQSFKFSMAQEALQALRRGISEAVTYVKELDRAMNSIQIVTGKTASEMQKVTKDAIESARQLRVSAKDYADASLIFYQQGLPDAEVKRRSDTTIMAAKAAGQSVSEMSQQLTAVWNTYQMEGDQLERAASIGAKLGAETAVDFKYIAEAMGIAATSAAQLGTSYESLSSIIATVGSVTQQSASVIGTAYRTIFTRLSNLKLDGETEDGVTLGRITKQLAEVGVSALDANGELRKTDELIMELGTHWGEYSQAQQAAIAQVVGGTRQFGQFLALMQNFDAYLQNLQSATSETGAETLTQQYETSLDTIESRAVNAAEAWKRAFAQIFTTDSLKTFYSLMESAGNVAENFIDGFGGLQGVLLVIGNIISRKITAGLVQAGQAAKSLWDNRTVNASMKTLDRQITAMQKKILEVHTMSAQTKLGPQAPSANVSALAKSTASTDLLKVEMTQRATAATIQLNHQIERGSELTRIQAESQKMIIQSAHEKLLVELDTAAAYDKQFNSLSRIAHTYQSSNNESTRKMGSALQSMGMLQQMLKNSAKIGLSEFDTDLGNKFKAQASNVANAFTNLGKSIQKDFGINVENTIQRINNSFNNLGKSAKKGNLTDINVELTGIYQQVRALLSEIKTADPQAFARIFGDPTSMQNFIDLLSKMGISTDQIIADLGKLNMTIGNVDPFARYRMGAMGFINTSVQMISSISMLSFGLNSLATMADDGKVSFTEFAGAMAMVVPSAVQLITQVGSIIAAILAKVVAMKADSAATDKNTADNLKNAASEAVAAKAKANTAKAAGAAATGTAAMGKAASGAAGGTGLLASAAAALGISVGALVAIIAAVVAAIALLGVAIYAMYQNWKQNTAEYKLQQTQEALADTQDAIAKTSQAASDLASSFDQYDTAVEALKNCTVGTDKWRAKLLEVNTIVDTLLGKFPELYPYLTYDQNGVPSFANGAEEAMGQIITSTQQANQIRQTNLSKNQAEYQLEIARNTYHDSALSKLRPNDGSDINLDMDRLIRENASKGIEGVRGALERYLQDNRLETYWGDDYRTAFEQSKGAIESYITALNNLTNATEKATQSQASFLANNERYQKASAAEQAFVLKQTANVGEEEVASKRNRLGQDNAKWLPWYDGTSDDIEAFNKWSETVGRTQYGSNIRSTNYHSSGVDFEYTDAQGKTQKETVDWDALANAWAAEDVVGAVNDQANKVLDVLGTIDGTIKNGQEQGATKEEQQQGANAKAIKDFLLGDGLGALTAKEFNQFSGSLEGYKVSSSTFAENQNKAKELLGFVPNLSELQILGYDTLNSFLVGMQSAIDTSGWDGLKTFFNSDEIGLELTDIENLTLDSANRIKSILENNQTEVNNLALLQEGKQAGDPTFDTAQAGIDNLNEFNQRLIDLAKNSNDGGEALNRVAQNMNQLGITSNSILSGTMDGVFDAENLSEYADQLDRAVAMQEKFSNVQNMMDADGTLTDEESSNLGMEIDDFEAYVDQLYAAEQANEDLDDSQKRSRKAIAQQTEEVLESAKALNDLAAIWEDYGDLLKDGSEDLDENSEEWDDYQYALSKVKKSFGELTKIDANALSSTFWNPDNMALLEQAINGSSEALDQLRAKASEDIALQAIRIENPEATLVDAQNLISNVQNLLANAPAEITADMDTSGVLTGLASILAQTGMTVGAAQALMAGLGFSMDVEPKEAVVQSEQQSPSGWQAVSTPVNVHYDVLQGEPPNQTLVPLDGTVSSVDYQEIPGAPTGSTAGFPGIATSVTTNDGKNLSMGEVNIKSLKKIPITGNKVQSNRPRTSGGGGSKPKGGGGDKGGGGSDFKPKEKRDPRDQAEDLKEKEDMEEFVERYENIGRALEDNAAALEKAGDAGDRLFGKGRAQALMEQNKLLEEQNELLDWQIEDAKKYVQWDKDNLINAFGIPEELLETNEDGSLKYREQIMQILEDRQEQQRQEYNAAMEQIHLAENKLVDDYNAAGDDSEEANKAYEDASKELEYQKKAWDDKWERQQNGIQDTIDALDEFEEAGARVFDGTQQKLENLREMWDNAFEARELIIDVQLEINEKDIDFYEYIRDGLGEDLENAALRTQYLKLEANELGSSWIEVQKRANDAMWDIQNADPAANMEDLWDTFDGAFSDLMDIGQQLRDIREEYKEEYINALEDLRDRWDELNGEVERQQDLISGMNDLLRETGLIYKDNSKSIQIMDNYVESMSASLKLSSEEYQSALAREQELQEQLATWEKTGNKAMIDDIKEELAVAQEWRQEAQLGMIEAGAALASAVTEAMEHFRDVGEEAWMDQISTMFNSFEDGAELLDQKLDLENYYMHENDKAFAIEEMIWQIEDAIEATSDPGQLDKYQELLDDLNAKKTDGKKVTEDEMEIYKAQLDLMLEQARLEDARNAKNSMRLARDASGNWSYVYSQDTSETEDLERSIAEKQHNIDKMWRDYEQSREQEYYQILQDMHDFQQSKNDQLYATDENYRNWYDSRYNMYKEQLNNSANEINKALDHTGNDFKETALGYVLDMDNMDEANKKYQGEIDKWEEACSDKYKEYSKTAEDAFESVGWDMEDLAETMADESDNIIGEIDNVEDKVIDLQKTTEKAFTELISSQNAFRKSWVDNMQQICDSIDAYLERMQKFNQTMKDDKYDFSEDFSQEAIDTIISRAPEDYRYDPEGSRQLDGVIAAILNNRQMKLDAMSEEERAKYATNEEVERVLMQLSPSDLKWLSDLNKAAMLSESEMYQKYLVSEGGEGTYPTFDPYIDDFAAGMELLIERGLKGTFLYNQLRVGRQKKINVLAYNNPDEYGAWYDWEDPNGFYNRYAKGGYTGNGSLSKGDHIPALLSSQEYVLNPEDTKNILRAVKVTRDIVQARVNGVLSNLAAQYLNITPQTGTQQGELKQKVKIEANFPNVQNRTEIEAAFDNLINKAAQYVLKDE